MLAGLPATMVYLDLAPVDMHLGGMLPADLDGPAPPGGSPGYFVQVDDNTWGYSGDRLQVWRFHVDWARPAQSTFTRAGAIPTEPFDSDLCGYSRTCIPQPGTTAKVDAMADRLMYRLQYRNFGDHESLVVNHTVDVDGNDHAGIRWYELRDPGSAPFIYQQGTYAPDADHRWMASAAMDGAGDLAIGYSVSGPATAPSVRYAGRLANDPPGILTQAETTVVPGAGAQTSATGRWGDYSMLTVDPTDDCTFWYTQEYYTTTSDSAWHTRIGAFSFPSCQPSSEVRVTVAATATPAAEAGPVPGSFTMSRTGDTSQPLTVMYSLSGSASPDVDYVALPGSLTIPAGSASATLTVMPIDDLVFENDESVVLTISLAPGYRPGTPADAVVMIRSDELPPDLVVSVVTAPAMGGAGETIAVNDTTSNQGTGGAAASMTAFYLSTDVRFDSIDVRLGTRAVPALAAGASSAATTALIIPQSTTAGTYYVIARADADDSVPESAETDNVTATGAMKIGPDLAVSAVSGPSIGGSGGTIVASVTTINQGGGVAAASSTGFYLSQNVSLDLSDSLIGTRAVPPLARGASDAGSASLTIPQATQPGQYYIIARADSANAVPETVESNNSRYFPIRIGPDLAVPSLSAPSMAAAGGTADLTDTTANQGGESAAASTTKFYLSTNFSLDASDVLLGSRTVPPLGAGESSRATSSVTLAADTPAGSYYVLARADGTDAVGESVETNNVSSAVLIRIGPDLRVTSLSAPTTAGAGTTITVTDTTANQSSSTSPSSTTTFYLSASVSLDSSDVLLGHRDVPALAAGTASTASTALQIPANTATKTYYVLAKADGLDLVPESNETNNVSLGEVVRIGPDLTASGVSATVSGTTLVVSDTTANQGGGPAGASTTSFYLSANISLDGSDAPLGSRDVPALAASTSSSASTQVPVPAGTTAGTYYVLARADGSDSVVETVETNNVSFGTSVRIGPDLTASVTAPSRASAGGTIAVTDTTTNKGNGAAAASTTDLYLSTNITLDSADVFLGSRMVPALNAGASSTASTSVQVPPATATGTYYVLAKADGDGVVAESVETNNVSSGAAVRVGPDLIVAALSAPSSVAAGGAFTVTDTTSNQGAGSAAASSTMFYLSTNLTFDASDVLLGSRAVKALDPGMADSAPTGLMIPAGTPATTYYVIAVAVRVTN
jgi:subtilase family serine protease